MVEITKIEKKDKDSENFLITFITDGGDSLTIERNYHHIADERLLKELVWNTAKKHDYIKNFKPITTPIIITQNDITPIEPQVDEKILAVIELSEYKRDLELGLITQQEYDQKLQEIKLQTQK